MESVQKEHERVWKKSKLSKTIDQTQEIIDALQNARDALVAEPTSGPVTLAKLQNPIKNSFETMNAGMKEIHGGHNKYAKVLDKLFKDKPLPSNEIDALSPHPALVNRAIYLHLLREGLFSVATTFNTEAIAKTKLPDANASLNSVENGTEHIPKPDKLLPADMEGQFATMYYILSELKDKQNLWPAIAWAREHTEALEKRGSNLEFELCRLQFVHLYQDASADDDYGFPTFGQRRALRYARQEFQAFRKRYLHEIQQLMGAMAYCSNLEDSPYRSIFNNTTAWEEVANSFTREFCSMLELSADSPLYIAATAGAIALPTLLKLQNIMQQKRTEWTTENELPVEIPLPPSYQFHSIFVCPVSKEQTTDQNPPMMMPCGHVIAQESLQRLSKGSRFKCPYCPSESHPREAKRVYL